MSGLKTTDIDETAVSGGGIPKTLQPGNTMAKVNSLELSQYSKIAKERNGYYVMLHLEGPDMGDDFEGFFIDKDNEEKGRHKGQVAKVKTHNWPYADGENKSGTKYVRDFDILKDFKRLCVAYGCLDWFDAQNDKHDTIEAFVEELNKSCPFIGQTMNFCITGREYISGENYKNWDLTLAPYTNSAHPYESITVPKDDSKLIKFNPDNEKHIERVKEEKMDEFKGDLSGGASQGSADNVDDKEFEV